MRIIPDIKLDFDDVLLTPKRSSLSSRKDVLLEREFKFQSGPTRKFIPLMISNMDSTGTVAMAKALGPEKAAIALHKHYPEEKIEAFWCQNNDLWCNNIFYTMGISKSDGEKFSNIWKELNKFPYMLCLDVANGYTDDFNEYVKYMRSMCKGSIIMAGNVVTPNMTEELLNSGADIVKVGIGSGKSCTTRIQTGVGYPQLSAVMECADAAHGLGGYICSDGGVNSSGDVAKAFAAGADFVMMGNMFAGTDECEGEFTDNNKFKFYGMASADAMERYNGNEDYKCPEGRSIYVDRKGSAVSVFKDILGGLRSCCTYVGAKKLKDLPKCATFVRVNRTHNE